MSSLDNFLTTAELAVKLKTGISFILAKTKDGTIPSTKIGRQYRFDLDKVIKALDKESNNLKNKAKKIRKTKK